MCCAGVLLFVLIAGMLSPDANNNNSNEKITTDILNVDNATLQNNFDYRNFSNENRLFSMDYEYKSVIVFRPTTNEQGIDEYYENAMNIARVNNHEITNTTIGSFNGELIYNDKSGVLTFLFVDKSGTRYLISTHHNNWSPLSPGERDTAKKVFNDVLTAWNNG